MLCNTFISGYNDGIKCTLSKFAEDTKLSGIIDKTVGRDAIQMDTSRLEERAHGELISFSRNKSKELHLSQSKPRYVYRLEGELLESSPAEKNLGNPGGRKISYEPAVCICKLEGQCYPRLHQEGRQERRGG